MITEQSVNHLFVFLLINWLFSGLIHFVLTYMYEVIFFDLQYPAIFL